MIEWKNLNISHRISWLYNKMASQIGILSLISKCIDVSFRKRFTPVSLWANLLTLHLLVCHYFGKTNNAEIEEINERALRISYKDYTPAYDKIDRSLEISLSYVHEAKWIKIFLNL